MNHLPGEGWKVRYCVAARWPEGYGGVSEYATEAEAIAKRDRMIGLGYDPVDVWAVAHRWIVRDAAPAATGRITGSTSLRKWKRKATGKKGAPDA